MTRPIRQIGDRLDRFQRNATSGFRNLADMGSHFRTGFLAVGAAIASVAAAGVAALRELIHTGMEFDAVMATAASRFSDVRTPEQLRELEEAAIEASRRTGFTAVETAGALAELGASGADAATAIQQLPVVLDVASAAGISLAEAGDTITDMMSAFALTTDDAAQRAVNMARVADVMARGANATSQSFEQLQGALSNVAAGAQSAGINIETTVAMIGALADAGEKGERAGTRLNAMLGNLRTPTREGARAMRQLHIETRNHDGSLRDAIDIVQDFERALGGMNDAQRDAAMANIFDEQGRRSMLLLLGQGSERLRALRTDFENSAGSAEQMAERMRDSGAGDMAIMTAEIEALKLGIWSLIRGPVRAVIQSITGWVQANEGIIRGGLADAIATIRDHMDEIKMVATGLAIVFGAIAVVGLLISAVFIGTAAVIMLVISTVVGGVVVALGWLYENVVGIATSIQETFVSTWESIVEFLTPAIEFIVGAFTIVKTYAMRALQPVFELLGAGAALVRSAFVQVASSVMSIWSSVRSEGSSAFASLLEVIAPVVDQIRSIFGSLGDAIAAVWAEVAAAFSATLGPIIDTIVGVVGAVRQVGRDEMDGEGGGGRARPQVQSPQERTARSVQERTTTDRAEVTIRDETGRAQQTRRPRNRGAARIRVAAPSGAL